jgi:FKBP12-rapamycin complex-associated protein
MKILRDNQDSVMAMLEAFVYDPLISWRLVADNKSASVVQGILKSIIMYSYYCILILLCLLCGYIADTSRDEDDEIDVEDSDDDVVSKAASSIKDLDINASNQSKDKKELPARVLNRHGSVSNFVDSSSQDVMNSRAIEVINRIQSKLNGRDFDRNISTDDTSDSPVAVASTVEEQVNRLIIEATSVENLCQLFVGWCPFW